MSRGDGQDVEEVREGLMSALYATFKEPDRDELHEESKRRELVSSRDRAARVLNELSGIACSVEAAEDLPDREAVNDIREVLTELAAIVGGLQRSVDQHCQGIDR